ncbi:MAG: hypothetical protein ACM3MG_09225 [Bacillota bacterium]
MKKLILFIVVALQVNTSFAKEASVKRAVASSPRVARSYQATQVLGWSGIRADLVKLTAKFQSKDLTDDQKVSLLPVTNELLSYMQDIAVTEAEKMDQIDVVVKLLAASLNYDFASSNEDTVYFEFMKHKGAYQRAIKALPDVEIRRELLDTFSDLEASTAEQSEAGEEN